MNAKVERKERSHDAILASAERLLRQHGIAGARVADVMGGAGLTVGGFYAHFASKEELIDETIRRAAATIRAVLLSRIEDKPAADRAEVIVKRYLSTVNRDMVDQSCPLPAIIGEVGNTAPEHRDALAEQIEALTAALGDNLEPGRALPKRTIAIGLVALMSGGLSMARAFRGTAFSDEILKCCRAVGAFVARAESKKGDRS